MAKEIKNIGASVRARLLQFAKASGQSFDLVLTRFALERLLFRLSRSPHADRFVLKGAMLMMSWFDDPHRGTRDLDLLGFGDPNPSRCWRRSGKSWRRKPPTAWSSTSTRFASIASAKSWNMADSDCGRQPRSAAPVSA